MAYGINAFNSRNPLAWPSFASDRFVTMCRVLGSDLSWSGTLDCREQGKSLIEWEPPKRSQGPKATVNGINDAIGGGCFRIERARFSKAAGVRASE